MNTDKKTLALTAAKARLHAVTMVHDAASGHPGGSLSCLDVLTALYFDEMKVDPANPQCPDRDRFVMSKGHCSPALYPVLAMRGFFPEEELKMFRRIDGHMSGHVEMNTVPGVDMSTGSLGQGISTAVGMALAAKVSKKDYYSYAVLGDGEIQEGQIWEACMYAGAHGLDHLIAIVDSNKVQLDGTVKEILDTGDLKAKFESFGFHTQSIDGHNVEEIAAAIDAAKATPGKPHMIIANTVKGKCVSFMEGRSAWHGKTPNDEQFDLAFADLAEITKEVEK